MSRAPDAALDALLGELAALYAEVDRAHEGWSCPASTECCRFGITGREPYVTSIELAALRRAVARRGGTLSTKRRALPMARDERTCAFLDREGRCSVYASRPLGCRTFFCERASGPARIPRTMLVEWSRRVQSIAARHEPGGDRTRPLSRVEVG